jgi:hypothetical protein
VSERLAGGVGAHAVEDVVLADGGHLHHLAAVDHLDEVGLVLGDRIVLLHPSRHLQRQEPLLVRIVPQLGGNVDARGAPDGLAAILFDEPGGLSPGIHLRRQDCGGRSRRGFRRRHRRDASALKVEDGQAGHEQRRSEKPPPREWAPPTRLSALPWLVHIPSRSSTLPPL